MSTPPTVLIVRRLRDLEIHRCTRCGEQVAVFPAGQAARRADPSLQFVCMECQPPSPGDAYSVKRRQGR